jgi:hypothetical protein
MFIASNFKELNISSMRKMILVALLGFLTGSYVSAQSNSELTGVWKVAKMELGKKAKAAEVAHSFAFGDLYQSNYGLEFTSDGKMGYSGGVSETVNYAVFGNKLVLSKNPITATKFSKEFSGKDFQVMTFKQSGNSIVLELDNNGTPEVYTLSR